jgi:hypothetical protein
MRDIDFFQSLNLAEQFDARARLPGFETAEAARQASVRLQAILDRADDEQAAKLVKILSGCADGSRCRSSACPLCGRMFRVKFAGKVSRPIAHDKSDCFSVSVVPPHLGFRMERLHLFNPKRLKDQTRKQLERSALSGAQVIGGIDFAVQVRKSSPVWRPHLYLLVRGTDKDTIRNVFAKYYAPTEATPRPVRVRKINKADLLDVTTYAFKLDFSQRLPTTDGLGNNDTEKVDLEPDQWSELAPLLHEWGFTGRLFWRNCPKLAASLSFAP